MILQAQCVHLLMIKFIAASRVFIIKNTIHWHLIEMKYVAQNRASYQLCLWVGYIDKLE